MKIPLQARELEKYLRAEVESDVPELKYKHTLAYREYYHEDPSGFGWHLNVRDMIAFKAEGKRYTWGCGVKPDPQAEPQDKSRKERN
jgi:hypothetical protein